MTAASDDRMLIVQMSSRVYAMRLQNVREVMRPLPVEPAPGTLEFVEGMAIVRGRPTPVVDLAAFIESSAARPRPLGRWVRVEIGDRAVAFAVDAVVGVRTLPAATVETLAPLLAGMENDTVERMARLDSELVRILGASKRLPDNLWDTLKAPSA